MDTHSFSCRQARQMDLVEYLEKNGFSPAKIRNNDYWFFSPFREEKEPSFKVNRQLNVWYDYGMGKGGNIIDFGILYHKCSVKDLLQNLQAGSYVPKQLPAVSEPDNNGKKGINILGSYEITDHRLCSYLEQRKIPLDLAEKYCREVRYELYGKGYTALGFRNNSGGYELRSLHFKSSSSPKDVTLVDNGTKEIAVMEGFFSFLSYLVLRPDQQHLTNFLVLNSLSFFERNRPAMEIYDAIQLYLDRDAAGIKCTQKAFKWSSKYADLSQLYRNHKDLNEYLVQSQNGPKQIRGLHRGF